jgi:SAM-dependent methyltransferase
MRRFEVFRPEPPVEYREQGTANAPDAVQFEGVVFSDGTVAGAELAFTAHNIVLDDGTQTLPARLPVAENGICQAALRDLELAFPGLDHHSRSQVEVADLGCLEGGYAAAFARAGYDVTGIEARTENFTCCQYVARKLALPNLRFGKADVRAVMAEPDEWDAVFACGILYHLENPVAFLHQLGKVTRRLLIVQSHFSVRPDAEHEGRSGHWYAEGATRWSAWKNEKSFWLAKPDLMTAMRDAGFDLVFEQADFREDITACDSDDRSMFVGVKI